MSTNGRTSPADDLYMGMEDPELNKAMVELMGRKANFTTSWDDAMNAAEELGLLYYPRFLYRHKQTGIWTVKENLSKNILARGETGPIVICRCLLILSHGKGNDYGEQTSQVSSVRGYGRRGSGLRGRGV